MTAQSNILEIPLMVEETVRRQRSRLLNFIRRRIRSADDAEDITQDVIFQYVDNFDAAEPIENAAAWLYRVARNKIIDWYRKRRDIPLSLLRRDDGEENAQDLDHILFDQESSPDLVYARSLVWPALTDALDEMPEEQREVFVLHELEGKSFKAIAEITGEPINTLFSRKRYAILFLRDRLRELYEEL